uniref:30S ribosomal protein S2 n=1 Tax=Myoviridae sp. ct8mY9 TaxID=2827664 RepID=A0A8S5SFK3_9CAUD|nr:MAG TPA: 30S ribosomal protein S2 [Myoviridae sp. ct8mY9]
MRPSSLYKKLPKFGFKTSKMKRGVTLWLGDQENL